MCNKCQEPSKFTKNEMIKLPKIWQIFMPYHDLKFKKLIFSDEDVEINLNKIYKYKLKSIVFYKNGEHFNV